MQGEWLRFGDGGALSGVYHAPAGKARDLTVVLCAPFAEEKKCSYRTFVETARAFAAAGVPCLQFDYYGTGDSGGAFHEFSPSRAIEDIAAAASKAREVAAVRTVALLGLRLGGTLALAAAPRVGAESAVLWQPVADGRSFFNLTLKRQMLRRQLIRSQGESGRCSPVRTGERLSQDVIDLDGFPLSKAAGEEIAALNAAELITQYAGPIRLLQIAHNENMSRDSRRLIDTGGDRLTFAAVVCEPFWSRIDRADATRVIETTLAWLTAPSTGRAPAS